MKSSVQLVVTGTDETGAPIEPPPPFEISYRGSLSNPGSSFAQNAIEGYLNKKFSAKANKLIQDKLGDKLDGELGNVVGGLLGLKPQQQQQAPVQQQPVEQQQAPANDNTTQEQQSTTSPYTPESVKVQQQKEAEQAQQVETTPEPVPAEQPKKQDTEDVVKDLAKDVLKGFLQ